MVWNELYNEINNLKMYFDKSYKSLTQSGQFKKILLRNM